MLKDILLGTQNDKCISFTGTSLLVCVFSPHPPLKEKKDFILSEIDVALSLELHCHLELLLGFCPANFVYMEDSFMRVIDLNCLFANIFQFIVPLYSSAKHIVLQTRKRKTLSPEAVSL